MKPFLNEQGFKQQNGRVCLGTFFAATDNYPDTGGNSKKSNPFMLRRNSIKMEKKFDNFKTNINAVELRNPFIREMIFF